MSDNLDPGKLEKDIRPAIWTPEDASRFLTAAIHEAQRPLAEALRQRPVTTRGLLLIVGIMFLSAAAVVLFLSRQLEKVELTGQKALGERERAVEERLELQTRADGLESRLAEVQNQNSGLRADSEELRRIREENQRFRRQTGLLRSQISGLELEKQALLQQLEAVRALIIDAEEEKGGVGVDEEKINPASPENGYVVLPPQPLPDNNDPPLAPASQPRANESEAANEPAGEKPAAAVPGLDKTNESAVSAPASADREAENGDSQAAPARQTPAEPLTAENAPEGDQAGIPENPAPKEPSTPESIPAETAAENASASGLPENPAPEEPPTPGSIPAETAAEGDPENTTPAEPAADK
ncbi:MAG: hypothetical protein LBU64_11215 [Planctomycetota bacterium]|jgi:hypothetical protein|nr:hypothetical protein [Planctomycetota bacterium]